MLWLRKEERVCLIKVKLDNFKECQLKELNMLIKLIRKCSNYKEKVKWMMKKSNFYAINQRNKEEKVTLTKIQLKNYNI